MHTVHDLKQRFIDYLMSMDLSAMDIHVLQTYSYILKTMDDMERPDFNTSLIDVFSKTCALKNPDLGAKDNG